MNKRKKLLLHSCCGPCSTAVVERLLKEYEVTLYFTNSNITDPEEYEKRKATQIAFLDAFNKEHGSEEQVQFREGTYDPEVFYGLCRGLEQEKEGGERCPVCFRMRMEETARKAREEDYAFFGTTLSVSPHKNYRQICEIGKSIEEETGVTFLQEDFKKKAGFQRSIELSKEYGLYRQNYCGCSFSEEEARKFREQRENRQTEKPDVDGKEGGNEKRNDTP